MAFGFSPIPRFSPSTYSLAARAWVNHNKGKGKGRLHPTGLIGGSAMIQIAPTRIAWERSLEQAQERADAETRPILLDFFKPG